MRIMEELDIDDVVDVPDTPDRLASRSVVGGESVGRGTRRTSVDIMNENHMNGLRAKDRPSTQNGLSRRPNFHPPKGFSNSTSFGNPSVVSPMKGRLFRKAVDESSSHGVGADKGKSISIDKAPSSYHHDGRDFSDFRKWHGNDGSSKLEDKRKGKVAMSGSTSGPRRPESLEVYRSSFVGNEKINENTPRGSGLASVVGETIVLSPDSRHRIGEHSSSPINLISPRVAGRKSLVRNGCISPQNVAKAGQFRNSSKGIEQSHTVNGSPNFPAPPRDIISEIVAEENSSGRMKGKATLTIPNAIKKPNDNMFFATSSKRGGDSGEANSIISARRDASGSQGLGGWRTTHNYLRKPESSVPDVAENNSRIIDNNGNFSHHRHENRVERRESRRNYPIQYGPSEGENDVAETGQTSGRPQAEKWVPKRLKQQGPSSSGHVECSTPMSEDQDVLVLEPSRESMRSRSTQRLRSRATMGSIIELDDLSPPVRRSSTRNVEDSNDDGSDVRAMQVQADEILARELQEQLYHEMPIAGGDEIDEQYLAWALEQDDNDSNTSEAIQNTSHSRGSGISNAHRQPRRSTQTRPVRRGGISSRASTSSRMAQIRGQSLRQRFPMSSRARSLQFPLGMDLDRRLDILEALEAAVGDFREVMPPMSILRRDFNENDYEMLLALDDENHRHGGASRNLINSLPQSVVQTENQEDCAICLETPAIGETVRHLPCLHKFHKECIDPWLSQKTSCPVCKSSIT